MKPVEMKSDRLAHAGFTYAAHLKSGAAWIDGEADLLEFVRLFAQVSGPKILVHGGGKGASEMMKKPGHRRPKW